MMKFGNARKFVSFATTTVSLWLMNAATAMAIGNAPLNTAGGQGLGQIAVNITNSFQGVGSALAAFCYVGGITMLIAGILKFKAHKDDPRQTPLSTPIVLWVCAILFAFAPSVLTTGGATLFGAGVSGVSSTGGF